MSSIMLFDFEDAAVKVTIRTLRLSGEPWFALTDVCKVLGIGNPADAASRLDDDEKQPLTPDLLLTGNVDNGDFNGLGSFGLMPTLISESGVYSLALTSRKPQAKRFKKWLTSEVLPAIRKTGGYMVAALDETPEALAIRSLTVLQATVERQKAQIAAIQPKADALDLISTASGSLCITDAAKALQVKPKTLFTHLQSSGWIYRRPGGSGYLGYSSKTIAGLIEHKVTTIIKPDGEERIMEQPRITAKGLTKLAKQLAA
jgi:prophage antirepressor-like protein